MKKYKIGLGADNVGYIVRYLTEEQYLFLSELKKEFDECPVDYMGFITIKEIKEKEN